MPPGVAAHDDRASRRYRRLGSGRVPRGDHRKESPDLWQFRDLNGAGRMSASELGGVTSDLLTHRATQQTMTGR
jgi:hypothetical protein